MYCDKCGQLAHADKPCNSALIQPSAHTVSQPIITGGPTMVVVSPQNRQLGAAGWGARSFAVAAGVIVALAATVVILLGSLKVYSDGLAVETNAKLRQAIADVDRLTSQAKDFALPHLAKHGIVAMSDDTVAAPYKGDVVLVGTGKAKEGGLKKFAVRYHVASFGKEQRWALQSLVIDDEEHYRPE
jgi:hypothetical protein